MCQDRGFLAYDVPPGDPRFGAVAPCRCQLAARRQGMFVGEMAGMTLASYRAITAAERTVLRIAQALARTWATPGATRGSLVLYAPLQDAQVAFGNHGTLHVTGCGCGKTHLAVSLAKVALDAGRDVKFATETDLLRDIKRSYGDDSAPSEAALLADLGRPWLTVLDDVGTVAVKSVDWYQDIVYAIVNQRYMAGLPIVLTANLTPEALRERVGSRTWSRLLGMAEVCRLDGPDRREMRR